MLGGGAAGLGHLSLPGMVVTVVVAAIVGDSVGYEVGRHLGPRLVAGRMLRSRRERLDRAREFLARRGGAAVFLGRFVAFRAVMPALAGTAGMRCPRFLAFNAAGGIVWATLYGLLYYFFGSVLSKLSTTINVTLAVAGLLVIVAFIVWSRRKEHELLERAEREIGGTVAEELGEDDPAT